MLINIKANFEGTTRFDKMKGRQYLVASMIMLVEGVHEGSNGPLFYPAKELKKSKSFWNAKPVVVYHPQENGKLVSACDPDILTNHGVGMIMNTTCIGGKLKAEAWIDVERANAVDDRIMTAIDNNEMMELSTGLVAECDGVEGDWNGEEYTGTLSNFHPDHLALLPDLQGACSIEDGAGFLRLNKAKDSFVLDISTMADKERKYVLSNKNGIIGRIGRRLSNIMSNEISFDDTRQRLQSLVREKFPDEDFIWIEDVFDNFFVYEKGGNLYKQEYEDVDNDVSFVGLPVMVVKDITYVIKNVKNNIKTRKEKKMDKKKVVNSLIANETTLWEDDDREDLMAMELAVLERMVPVENKEEEAEEAKKKKETETAVANVAKKGAEKAAAKELANKETKPQTADEYIANAPKEIQSMLRNGMDSYTSEKAKVIAFIIDNERCIFTKEQLEAKDLLELKTLATLAANTEERKETLESLNNYSGQAEVVNSEEEDEESMIQPTVNWAEEAKLKRKKAS